jgi:hypothetical protein
MYFKALTINIMTVRDIYLKLKYESFNCHESPQCPYHCFLRRARAKKTTGMEAIYSHVIGNTNPFQ